MSYSQASSIVKPCSTLKSNNTIASSFSSLHRNMTGRRWFTVSCNKCQKEIDSTVFICSCKCLFCEDCTYNHFQSNSNCPGCGYTLGENDFTEIMISDPGSKLATNADEIFQSLLTKTSMQPGTAITWNDMCTAVMREQDAALVNTKIFVKQLIRKAQRSLQERKNTKHKFEAYQKQLQTLKKDIRNLIGKNEEYLERLQEKDRHIQQLKNMLSRGIRSKKDYQEGVWEKGSKSTLTMVGVTKSSAPASAIPHRKIISFKNYVRQKEKDEKAQERDLIHIAHKKNPMAHM